MKKRVLISGASVAGPAALWLSLRKLMVEQPTKIANMLALKDYS
jgi:hypothetical protein